MAIGCGGDSDGGRYGALCWEKTGNLVYYGLKVLNKTQRPGLLSFIGD